MNEFMKRLKIEGYEDIQDVIDSNKQYPGRAAAILEGWVWEFSK